MILDSCNGRCQLFIIAPEQPSLPHCAQVLTHDFFLHQRRMVILREQEDVCKRSLYFFMVLLNARERITRLETLSAPGHHLIDGFSDKRLGFVFHLIGTLLLELLAVIIPFVLQATTLLSCWQPLDLLKFKLW